MPREREPASDDGAARGTAPGEASEGTTLESKTPRGPTTTTTTMTTLTSVAMDWELVRRSLEIYDTYPRLEANEVTREMGRLLGRTRVSRIVTGARRQQGLVHLYSHGTSGAGSLFETTGDSST